MKTKLAVLMVFFMVLQGLSQTGKKKSQKEKDDLIQKFEQINLSLANYKTLSPYSLNDNRFRLIDSIGNDIVSGLLKLLNDQRITQYQIEKQLDENGLSISKSADSRIYFFSIDAKTGGSYKKNRTIIHYRLRDGKVKAALFGGEAAEALATSAYGKVHLLDSINQEYFVIGKVSTCNTCIASLALTLQIDSVGCQPELIAQYEGRTSNLATFDYKPEQKEFLMDYYAAGNDDSLYVDAHEKPLLLHRLKSKFKYLYGGFIETEKCEFVEKRD